MKNNLSSRFKILMQLFISMFTLSAFTFGGGFVIVSLMKKKFVEELKWFDEDEMLDITAISQSSPGPIPINASVIIGYRMAGVLGSLTGIIGTALPPMIIISIVAVFYKQFCANKTIAIALQVMRAGVAAVIFDVVINLAKNVCKTKKILYIGLMIISFIAVWFFDVSAMIIIFTCLIIGIINAVSDAIKAKHLRSGKNEYCSSLPPDAIKAKDLRDTGNVIEEINISKNIDDSKRGVK